jgi:hypothetical protein
MKRFMGFALVAALPLMLGGCFELRQDTTLNPDGSGKVVVETIMPDMSSMMTFGDQPAAKPDPDVQLKKFAKDFIDGSKGVDAWSDVSFSMAEDGRMKFKGTAYFKDITALKVGSGNGGPGGPASGGGLTWTKSDKGGMILALETEDMAAPKPPAPQPNAMTDDEIAKIGRAHV